VFLGWLRGERGHCGMVAIPTLADEDPKRPSRERKNDCRAHPDLQSPEVSAGPAWHPRLQPMLRKAPQRLAALRTLEGVPIPPNTLAEMQRDMARLAVVREQIDEIERARLQALQEAAKSGPHAMVRLLARIVGVGIETADMLVHEVLTRNLRDRRAVARGLIQLAWRFLRFQKNSALARWYRARTEGPRARLSVS
jgi:transposase